MSPLDDELRAALRGRAQVLTPAADPLAGIERRARRMRRNRVAASVAGSALAVAAIATAVPLLQTADQRTAPLVPPVASAEPTLAPAPSYALDPERPWAFRGQPVDQGTVETLEREYAAKAGGAAVDITPLFAQTYESSGQQEVVFLAESAGVYTWGVAQSTEAGPEFLWDADLPDPALALAAALPGDEGVARLLVVASPEVSRIEYGPDDASEFAPTSAAAPGVGITALEGDRATDLYRAVAPDGTELVREPAPDPVPAEATAAPANLLEWPSRGAAPDAELEERLLALFAQAMEQFDQEPLDTGVSYRPLFTGDTDGGVRYTIGQAWANGRDAAYTVALSLGGTEGEQFFLGPKTDPGTPVVATLLCCQPGSSVDTLVVVPQPRTGQVLYDDDAQGSFRPVGEGQEGLDGVVLVDRDRMADRDRLQLLDGNGDLDNPVFEGSVSDLLCGLRECG